MVIATFSCATFFLNSLMLWEKLPGPFASRVKNEVRSGPRQRAAFGFNDSTWLAVLTDETSIHFQLIAASCKQPIHLHPSLTRAVSKVTVPAVGVLQQADKVLQRIVACACNTSQTFGLLTYGCYVFQHLRIIVCYIVT